MLLNESVRIFRGYTILLKCDIITCFANALALEFWNLVHMWSFHLNRDRGSNHQPSAHGNNHLATNDPVLYRSAYCLIHKNRWFNNRVAHSIVCNLLNSCSHRPVPHDARANIHYYWNVTSTFNLVHDFAKIRQTCFWKGSILQHLRNCSKN